MEANEIPLLRWQDMRPEFWLTLVDIPPNAEALEAIPWPLEESVIRRVARKEGMLLERRGPDRYRLWDIRAQVRGQDLPVPVDLTSMGEFVDSLAGIAYFLSC